VGAEAQHLRLARGVPAARAEHGGGGPRRPEVDPRPVPHGFGPYRPRRYLRWNMSTRRLIITALLCGLAILVAFAIQASQL
jgi:hypothetical protein